MADVVAVVVDVADVAVLVVDIVVAVAAAVAAIYYYGHHLHHHYSIPCSRHGSIQPIANPMGYCCCFCCDNDCFVGYS